VLEIVKGFKIPFIAVPEQHSEPVVPQFSSLEENFILGEITKLLISSAISISVDEPQQFLSTVFTVPKPDGSRRFVINLKSLNEYIDAPHFKMEDIKCASSLIMKNCYMCVIDLKDAFHAISIHEQDRKYLKFRWNGTLYQFNCLPFGINVAPRLYTKLLRPVFRHLRSKGLISNSYLDDSLLIGNTYMKCMHNVSVTIKLFKKLGLKINYEKSQLTPSQEVKYLGFLLCSITMTIKLPKSKQDRILQKCKAILKLPSITLQNLAEFVGLLVSALPGIEYGKLYTRQLEYEKSRALAKCNGNYKCKISLSSVAQQDIHWWLENVNASSKKLKMDVFHGIVTTDASLTGWGAEYKNVETKGSWSNEEGNMLIDELELLAIFNGLKSFIHYSNFHILIRTDNTTALSYINKLGGCKSPRCHSIAKNIWEWVQSHGGYLTATYINTKDNVIADSLSRKQHDESDFMLGKAYFNHICMKFGNPEIDLFASYKSAQCKKYISFLPDPGSCWVDAFTYSWSDNFFYAFPPFNMIQRVLNKIVNDNGKGIVVVPDWPSQSWYPTYKSLLTCQCMYLKPDPTLIMCPYVNRTHQLSTITLMVGVLSKIH
jgi:hypothetical protein